MQGRWGRAFDDVARTVGECDVSEERWERGSMGNAILGSNYIKYEDLLMDVARGSLMVALIRMLFK